MDFTISQLEEKTGLNRRTIHFYVRAGVVDPPAGKGGGARYDEKHLLRLLLVRELQKSHLKLSGVQEALDRMTIEEMRTFAKTLEPKSSVKDKEALGRWLEVQGPASTPWNVSFLGMMRGTALPEDAVRARTVADRRAATTSTAQTRPTTWERMGIVEGVELHVRSDLASKYRRLLDDLSQQFRKGG